MISSFIFAVETNYQNLYYFNDGVVVACALFSIFFLKVKQMSTSQTILNGGSRVTFSFQGSEMKGKNRGQGGMLKSMAQMMNPVVYIFWSILVCQGMVQGITLDYGPIFMQNNLGASSSMIGESKLNQLRSRTDTNISKYSSMNNFQVPSQLYPLFLEWYLLLEPT